MTEHDWARSSGPAPVAREHSYCDGPDFPFVPALSLCTTATGNLAADPPGCLWGLLTPHSRPPTRLASAWGQESALKALDLGPLSRWARSHPSTTPLIFPICQAPTDFQNHSSTEKTHGNANMDKDGAKAKNRKHKGKEKTFTVPSAACPAALPTHLVS